MKYFKEIKNLKRIDYYAWFFLSFILIVLLATSSCFTDNNSSNTQEDKKLLMVTFEDSLSYSMGVNIGKNLPKGQLNKDLMKQGLEDYLNNKEPRLNNVDRLTILREFNVKNSEIERDEMEAARDGSKKLSRENKMLGQTFLDKNKTKEGVRTRQRSGLQYKVIRKGIGVIPDYDDTVVVHYNGYLVSGDKFDSSYDKGAPITLALNRFIPGWQEALLMMPVGSKWEVYVPYNLGYGETGIAGSKLGEYVIPPASTLVFEMELLDIVQ